MSRESGFGVSRCAYSFAGRSLSLYIFLVMFSLSVCGQQSSGKAASEKITDDAAAMVVGGETISVSELCAAIATLPPPQAQGYRLHPTLAAQWYGPILALAAEARREHLDGYSHAGEMHAYADQVALENRLAEELIQKLARNVQPDEIQIAQYYAAHQSEFERTKARHILISDVSAFASRSKRTPADAKLRADELSARLNHAADFATLATAESDDPYSKDKGGDLGEISHHQLEPAVDRVVWSLAPGKTSAPFEGRFGYEIVQVESRRTLPLDDVRQSIIGDIKFEVSKRQQQEIISAAHITLSKSYTNSPLPCASNALTLPKPSF